MIYKNLLLVLAAVVFALACTEAILRVVGFPEKTESGWGWQKSPGRVYSKYRQLNTNQFGLRGQEFYYDKDDYVVILIGDSQVESYASKPDLMPEKTLQRLLESELGKKVKVFSLASSGWGQDQQLLALQRYFKRFRADLVLVWATPGNDFWENTFPDRSVTKVAGHLKPTFKLEDGKLTRLYFATDFHYGNSAIVHLLKLLVTNQKNETMEQIILDEWSKSLPSQNEIGIQDSKQSCNGLIKIDQTVFYRDIYDLDPEERYLIVTAEDFMHGRSQFSPYSSVRSERDIYQIEITESLFEEMEKTAKDNGAEYFVFYPVRDDIDRRGSRMVKCVQAPEGNNTFPVTMDYVGLLETIISPEHLIIYDLDGGNELSVSINDRHLGDLGNELAMQRLIMELGNRLRKP